jgi:hypothetical protein
MFLNNPLYLKYLKSKKIETLKRANDAQKIDRF